MQGARARRPLSGGAAVAMVAHGDRIAREIAPDELREVHALAPIDDERQAEHLVEVAVVDVALPVDRQQRAAHHRFEILRSMRAMQQIHVLAELPLGDQHRAEALDRHVGESEQFVEHHAMRFAQVALVVRFELVLRGRQRRALRVVDEIQRETAARGAVAERVEAFQRLDALLVDAFAALPVDQLLGIARQRRGYLDALRGEELGESFLPGLLHDGEVAAVDDVRALLARAQHEIAKMGIQLRRAAGDVEYFYSGDLEKDQHIGDRLARHQLGALRAGVDVAVHAALVALVAEIDLQRFQARAPERREAVSPHQGERGVHALVVALPGAALQRLEHVRRGAVRLLVEQSEQPLAGHPQALRQHQHQLHEDFCAEQGLLDDDPRQVFAVEHRDQRWLDRDAGRKARLAVDHRHLAERPAGVDHREQLRRIPAIALVHLDLAFDQHQHEVAAVALADDLDAGFGAVDVHEMRKQAHFGRREILEQLAFRDQGVDLFRELGGVAEELEMRELLRAVWHGLASDYAESLLPVLAALAYGLGKDFEQLRRVLPAQAGVGNALAELERLARDQVLAAFDQMRLDHP